MRTFLSVTAVVILVAVASIFAFACKTATLTDAPDAAADCEPGAYIFCDAGVAPNLGCTIDTSNPDPHLAKLVPGTYPTGCVANFVSSVQDQAGDCEVEAVCKCIEGVDGGLSRFTCFP